MSSGAQSASEHEAHRDGLPRPDDAHARPHEQLARIVGHHLEADTVGLGVAEHEGRGRLLSGDLPADGEHQFAAVVDAAEGHSRREHSSIVVRVWQ